MPPLPVHQRRRDLQPRLQPRLPEPEFIPLLEPDPEYSRTLSNPALVNNAEKIHFYLSRCHEPTRSGKS